MKKGKLFGKVSVIDIILILIIIAAVIAVGFKTMDSGSSVKVKSDAQFSVTFRIDNVRQYTIDAIEEGDVFFEKNAAKLGTVESVYAVPYHEIVTLANGTSIQSPSPDKYSVYVTMACEGKEDDDGYYIGGTRQVSNGMEVRLKSYKLNCDATVDGIVMK